MTIHQSFSLTARQIELVRRTVARDCSREEFDLFIEAARQCRLDPFRRQIMPLIFNKRQPERRRMVILVGVDGQRVLAQRCGNYRPASEPPEYIYRKELKGPNNPLGILYCRTRLWQQDSKGEWFPVVGQAYWEEFAPLRRKWQEDPVTGQRRPTDEKLLDPGSSWPRMPRRMIAKCAEMQALRAGWPDQFGGLYAEEEMDWAKSLDLDASEIADRQEEDRRLASIGAKDAITVSWNPASALEHVPLGAFADRVLAWLEQPDRSADEVRAWAAANRVAMREFWARCPGDALIVKARLEATARLASLIGATQ
jgi:phage recombination protein Bet